MIETTPSRMLSRLRHSAVALLAIAILISTSSLAQHLDPSTKVTIHRTSSPDVLKKIELHLPQIIDFINANLDGLEGPPIIRGAPVVRLVNTNGVSDQDLVNVKRDLGYFGIDLNAVGASPNIWFFSFDSADEIRPALKALGLPKDRAMIVWMNDQALGRPACHIESLDLGGGIGDLAIIVARTQARSPSPVECLENSLLHAIGLSRSLHDFIPDETGELFGVVEADFIDRVVHCRTTNIAAAVASCVRESY